MKTLTLAESDIYFYDPEAADRPVRFIEKFCRHWEGKFAGQPFILLPWQRQLVCTLFGWKRRTDGLRRFHELYLLTAKGAGKTPLLAGIGLFMLLGDGEAAAHVISLASTSEQARLSFDAGQRYIQAHPALARIAVPMQYLTRVPKTSAKWTLVSGAPDGRSGPRPSCIIGDEIHEWPSGEGFELLSANLFKRAQPLALLATNAGPNRSCYAWQLHERAQRVLSGKLDDPTLLPIIYEAPIELDWTTEEAAAAANPSLGSIVTFDQLKPQLAKAQDSPGAESRYRRLYLSQWVAGSNAWLDMAAWDAATGAIDPSALKDAVLYVGVDLSLGDDLCAVVYVWVTPTTYYIDSHFWVPAVTAAKYEKRDSVPYAAWAAAGHVTLLPEPTISPAVRKMIAGHIIARSKIYKMKVVGYDTFRAEDTIAALEAAGITCVPIRQGFSLSPGCRELERRLADKSIIIAPNDVFRACAENVEIKEDDRGNIWPIKPGAKATYAGKRGAKIDGIAALVTALVEARKHAFPKPAARQWSGGATII